MKNICKKIYLFFALIATCQLSIAQSTVAVVPKPEMLKIGKDSFLLSSATIIFYDKDSASKKAAQMLSDILRLEYGIIIKPKPMISVQSNIASNYIFLSSVKASTESYELSVFRNSVYMAGSSKGLFYALQTLQQLLLQRGGTSLNKMKSFYIPTITIVDRPRFAYRGMHLDAARHFQPVNEVKKFIDYMAYYKFNVLHWHLTDDQGWRIQIKKYPLLTTVGAYRNGTIVGHHPGVGNDKKRYGGFYTQTQIKEIVQYAADRNISIIPEIEMPGHASAAIAAYPQLSCFPNESTDTSHIPWSGVAIGKQVQQTWGVFDDVFCPSEFTFQFLQDVLDEVIQLFPSKYIHIGGDECPKNAWKRSALCQTMIRDFNLKDEHGLQTYFIGRIEKYLNAKGRSIIGWDEILEGGLTPNSTIMSWRGEAGGIEAAKQKHDVIMCPSGVCYFDHAQYEKEDSLTIGGYTSLEKVYQYEPIPAQLSQEDSKYILGAQTNVWTEYITNFKKLQYMIFPRMLAMSEVLWSDGAQKDWNDFQQRLQVFYKRKMIPAAY